MGLFGGKKKAPDPPDYKGAAEAQGESSLEAIQAQTLANRPDQYTPWGSSEWSDTGDGRWRQDIVLDPQQQASLDAQMAVGQGRSELAQGLIGRAGEEVMTPPDWDPLSMNGVGTGADARQRAEDAIYQRSTSRLDPQWEQALERKESQLWNQGLRPGDEAYDTAMGNFNRGRTDAYQTAMDQSIIGGGAEASREFGLDLQRRQQAVAEQLKRRGLSINEMNALLTGQQVSSPEMPNVPRAGAAQPTQYLGAANMAGQYGLDQFSAEQAGTQGLWSGITGMAGAAAPYMGFSDRRLKSNIRQVGTTPAGQAVYKYTIFGREEIGVMADESPADAVRMHRTGYLMVDYGRIR